MIYRGLHLAGWVGIALCPGTAWSQDGQQGIPRDGLNDSVQSALESGRPNGFQLDVSAGGSYERNPFLLPGEDTGSAAVYVQIDPAYQLISDLTTVTFAANLRAEEYFRRYDTNLSARLGLDASHRLSPTTTLRGRVSGRSSRTNELNFFPAAGSVTPPTSPPIALPDVTLAGTTTRTSQIEAGLGLDLSISPRDQLTADVAASQTYFSGVAQSDFRYGSAAVDYSRKVSAQTSLSLSMRFSVFDYLERSADDGITFSPTVGIKSELGPRLSLDASAGVSVNRVNRIDGSRFSNVAAALRARMCYRSDTGSTCANAARQSQPTALSGLSTVTSFGVSTFRRLGSKDEISANVGYTLTSSPPEALSAATAPDLLSAGASYTHDFNRRFAGFVNASYTQVSDTVTPRRSNPGVRLGLRYRFGGSQ